MTAVNNSERLYRCSMDISRFDFELDEIVGLIPRLTGLAQIIELEPRLHNPYQGTEIHSVRTEPTFRIRCFFSERDQTVARLADLAAQAGVEAVLDLGRSVRFRHLGSGAIEPEQKEQPQPPGEQGLEPAPAGESGRAAGDQQAVQDEAW